MSFLANLLQQNPADPKGFAGAANTLSPLLFSMAAGLRSGQGAAAGAPGGLAAMMALQNRSEDIKRREAERAEKRAYNEQWRRAAWDREDRLREAGLRREDDLRQSRIRATTDVLNAGRGGPTHYDAMGTHGGPSRAAATAVGNPNSWEGIRAGIFAGESGGDYDALFGFSNRPGGRFANVQPSTMTVRDLLRFQSPSGEYGQYVASTRPDPENGVATPVGAFQVVGSTLRDAVRAGVVGPDEVFSPEAQDRVARWIFSTQGSDAWQGYRGSRISPRRAAEILNMEGLPAPVANMALSEFQAPAPEGWSVLDPARAASLGLDPEQGPYQIGLSGSNRGKITPVGGGGVSVNVNNEGSIPSGFSAVRDPQGNLIRYEPVPGGPADTSEEAALAAEGKETSANLVLDEISIARELIEGQSVLSPATGLLGGAASVVNSTRAGALNNRLTTIKANIGFDKLQAMRDASPTGGALGQVSEFENRLLQAVFGSLEQSQSEADVLYNLSRLEEIYSRIIHEGIPDDEAREMYRNLATRQSAPLQATEMTKEQFLSDPRVAAAAEQHGVTPQDMWDARQ